jgi:glucosyl-dolichyl phosphate glucuronosyltransferase
MNGPPHRPDVSVVIATYNRAALLDETLRHLAHTRAPSGFRWEAVVVDNNSTDGTPLVVQRHAADFPVALHYLMEPRQGRSSALNTGMAAAAGLVLLFTDDDVRVAPGWLEAGATPLLSPGGLSYTGGPVRPIWDAPPPPWLDSDKGHLWGTIAIQYHGDDPFVYEERSKVPLGANMGVRRALIERIGGFRSDLGRRGGRLVLGQEVPEFLARAHAVGARGLYVPAMQVDHHVPAARLTKSYFRRWWFGKGISRAAVERIQGRTELGLDLHGVPRVAGVPRFMFGSALRDARDYLHALLAREPAARFRHEMMLVYFFGYLWGARREAHPPPGADTASGALPPAVPSRGVPDVDRPPNGRTPAASRPRVGPSGGPTQASPAGGAGEAWRASVLQMEHDR